MCLATFKYIMREIYLFYISYSTEVIGDEKQFIVFTEIWEPHSSFFVPMSTSHVVDIGGGGDEKVSGLYIDRRS